MTHRTDRGTRQATRVASAGFVAIAVAFGPARNGYGLFLPFFRQEFGLSIQTAGLIASGLQAGYLVALCAVGLLAARTGPKFLVLVGTASAGLGLVLVAVAQSPGLLAAGTVLAGTSAGWAWAPYNDAADRWVPPALVGRVLSIVSTGTTFGILLAGLVALTVGAAWRWAWAAFAVLAAAAALCNLVLLPNSSSTNDCCSTSSRSGHPPRVRYLLGTASKPLFAVAFSFGLVSTFYWSFAADLVVTAGALDPSVASVLFVIIGVAGTVGLATGDAVRRIGLRLVLRGTLLALSGAAYLLGAAAGSWPLAALSTAVFGACVMIMSALLSVWSSKVFPHQPTTGFSATLLFFACGGIAGPAALGGLSGAVGLAGAFKIASGLVLLTLVLRPRL